MTRIFFVVGTLQFFKLCVEIVWACEENGREETFEKNNEGSCEWRELEMRSQMKWMDTVMGALNERGMSVEQGKLAVRDKRNWRCVASA